MSVHEGRADFSGGTNGRPIVEFEDLHKVYHIGTVEVRALDGITISIRQGGFVAIMGPSGSGKSTLLNILGCLDRPTSGRYLLGGDDVSQLSDDELSEIRSRRLGFIFQSYNLIPQLNVLENIEVPLFYQGLSPVACRERALSLAERVGLTDRLHHKPTELSGGQQQRVAIARSLANDPLAILADEPTGNLDSATGQEILELIQELHAQGKTIILVTHDERVAAAAERIVRLRDGRVERDEVREGAA
ncbi:MAG: ABC transporter ATP-binding protein [Planctomycetes bacterium]|nr:ABC transporter ATP-binding protein [Planctomycetota bacterium]